MSAGRVLFGAFAVLVASCSEFQARHARAGNVYLQDSRYADAIREYEHADELSPGLYAVSLNRGLACRELMLIPGAPSADRKRAVECALAAFSRLKELRPDDARADRLFSQTLFDAQRFDVLIAMYEARLEQTPDDLATINELIAVYSRADRWTDVLRWSMKRARIDGNDAEAQYTVGAMIFNRLSQKRGANVTGSAGVRLAELSIKYLTRAVELRPNYREAMLFRDLMRRHDAYGQLSEPAEWEFLDEQWFRDEQDA